ncbi:MAG: sugar phosphate isomerase/epimerase [Chthonomonadales bacterium]|nr:sugar phosphate isomerase/epimerase [Chthonomonadales bacterium]
MKIAVIPTTGGADPYQGMEVARELGVEGVHISACGGGLDLERKSTAERLSVLSRIQGMGLEVSCLIAWGGNVDLGEVEGLADNVAWGKRINETAVDMCGGLWMAHVGVMPEDVGSNRWARFRSALAEIARHGEQVGARLAMETGPEPPERVCRMIEEIGSPALAVNFDPANLLIWPPYLARRDGTPFDYDAALRAFDPVAGLRALMPYVAHVHAKDAVMRRDATFDEVPLGTGMADWPRLHRIFVESGYAGFYAIERECGEDAMGDVRRAVEYLRRLDAAD